MADNPPDGWIDVSAPVQSGMVHWPGDPEIVIERVSALERGDLATVSRLSLGAHTGTHMDAPAHFIPGGASIDQLPLSVTIGPARVIAIEDPTVITVDELRRHNIGRGERILFKTRNSTHAWHTTAFAQDFVAITPDAAAYLAERGVLLVGVDYLSVGSYREGGVETHRALLGAGVWIIEGLMLAHVAPGTYELVCLPLRIVGGDGAPARAVLRRVE